MQVAHFGHNFDFDQQDSTHDQIDALTWDHPVAVLDDDWLFALVRNATRVQLQDLGAVIDRFLEARAERSVNRHRAADGVGNYRCISFA